MINNHKGEWFKIIDGKKVHQNRCICCNKTHAELKKDFKRFSKIRKELEHNSKTRTMILHGFTDYIGTENMGSHYWYTWHGDLCRGCGGAPQSVGELFLAVYSEGQWYCNECYAKEPVDPKGHWPFMPANDDDEKNKT